MTDVELTAGKEVEAKCTKCKTVKRHTIVAMVDAKPKKVKCNTCDSEHRYIAPPKTKPKAKAKVVVRDEGEGKKSVTVAAKKKKPAAKKKPATRKKKEPPPPPVPEEEFDKMIEGKELGKPRKYAITETFIEEDLLKHKTLGLGLVTRVKGGGKIEVYFRKKGAKTMVHGR